MAAERATDATPSARTRPGKARNTRAWQTQFLKGLASTGTVTGACDRAKVDRSTAYRARQRDERFALKWADIDQEVSDRLEHTALTLALKGSERLLEFMLKARRPDVYREHHLLEHTGPDGGPIEVEALGLDLSKLSDRDLASLQRIAGRAR